jgi:hypothetical protein
MRVARLGAAIAALAVGPAFAQEPVGCDKFKWPVARETAALRSGDLKTIASGSDLTALPFAGFPSSKGVAPGLYSVSLLAVAWLDVVQNGQQHRCRNHADLRLRGFRPSIPADIVNSSDIPGDAVSPPGCSERRFRNHRFS